MSFTVIIPSKTWSNLKPCVEAIRRNEPQGPAVVVVDDGVETGDVIPGETERFCIWEDGDKPFIFARNVNKGIRVTNNDGYIILNDDAILQTPGGFTMLQQFADAHPEVGCVAPACNITGQRLQWPKFRSAEGWRYVDTVPYVCVYIPRRTFDRVGLLDERYCLGYGCEDADHIEAMKRAGLRVAVLYDVFVDHGSLRSSFRGDPKAPGDFSRNYKLFCEKWGKR